jgi:hypothetical protein
MRLAHMLSRIEATTFPDWLCFEPDVDCRSDGLADLQARELDDVRERLNKQWDRDRRKHSAAAVKAAQASLQFEMLFFFVLRFL